MLVDAVMGAAVYAVASRYPVADEEALERAAAEDLADELAGIVSEHVQGAVAEFTKHVRRQGCRLDAMSELSRD